MTSSSSDIKAPHPALFAALMYPTGAVTGYLSVAIGYDLSHHGVSVESVADLVAISFIPFTWKFLWAPLVDITLSLRGWFVISLIASVIGTLVMGWIEPVQGTLGWMQIAVALTFVALTFNGMSADGLTALIAPFEQKGRYGGWLQLGNLAGNGIGGGLALWLSQNFENRFISTGVLCGTCLLSGAALLFLPKVVRTISEAHVGERIVEVERDSWHLIRSRGGAMALLIMFLPLGSGAAGGLWSAVADEWQASADTVAFVTGGWNGVASGLGCLVGGYICDRLDRKWSYALFGVMQAGCAAAMGFAPHSEQMFIFFTLLYAVVTGLTYAAYSAVALEVVGGGAAATKYNLIASMANAPILYMTEVDGHAHTWFGASGMLYSEALFGVLGATAYIVIIILLARSRRAALDAVLGRPLTPGS